ncbi:Two-component response regulator-like APRR1 [Striga hermonthica]|uniref:Pseudo-response regulator 1 n=1 Tax=Striga hermonthica TaxID=68872 RepID=A0A9N7N578_STRHE|nr:Two-component response regulator-like APRR1 [Striga hermonthica]
MDRSEMGKGGDSFIDRSKVRILLCDNDEKSSEEVFTLLCKCSYQVTSVKSPRQVIDALNAEGPDIDIILSEVDLPMSKGMKMLKYIMRDKELRRIPVIMMSAQDEVPIVVKCLKLGAADYLVKPLRTNELLNLWTHMWRRRRMLGLAEKNIINYDLDLVVSDPSDANTNSTTLFSDDTDDKSRKGVNPDTCVSTHQENEAHATSNGAPIQTTCGAPSDYQPDVPELIDRQRGQSSPLPKKKELRIGESSAFFTYVKSSTPKSSSSYDPSSLHENLPNQRQEENNRVPTENHYHINSNSFSLEKTSFTTPSPLSTDEFAQQPPHFILRNDSLPNDHISNHHHYPHPAPYPYYVPPAMMGQVAAAAMQPPGGSHKMIDHAASSPLMPPPQYNHIMPPPYPYYPFGLCLQPGQIQSGPIPGQIPGPPHHHPHHQWPSFGSPSVEGTEKPPAKIDRREAALMKFRQKRKERCFDKKIRYVNRKKLAERRPRLRGQFVRKVNGVMSVDLNGQPGYTEDDEEEEEDYDEDDHSNVVFLPEDE